MMINSCPLGAETYLYTEPNITNYWCNGPALNELTPLMQEVMDMWTAKYTDPYMTDAAQVYDQAWVLVQGIQKAQSLDPNDVMAALESMTNLGDVQTTFGPARIGGMDRFGVNRVLYKKIPLTLIMDGEMELIGYFDGSYK